MSEKVVHRDMKPHNLFIKLSTLLTYNNNDKKDSKYNKNAKKGKNSKNKMNFE